MIMRTPDFSDEGVKAYYNENDPKAAAWLRELISSGHIAPGDVDERSIKEIKAHELDGYTQCHFFAGIGGWTFALALAGWPATRPVWTGSCPCQPFSQAGKQLGGADERHLWPDWFRLIRECRPEFVLGEQVASAIGKGWLDGVSADLESEGYACGAAVLGAHSVGAPHRRQRLYWMAHAEHDARRTDEPWRRAERRVTDGRAGGLVLADSTGRQPGLAAVAPAGHGDSVEPASGLGGLDDTASGGCGECRDETFAGRGGHAECAGGAGSRRVGDAASDDERRQRKSSAGSGRPVAAGGSSAWRDFDILPCRDGKARHVEAGTFPLVTARGTKPTAQQVADGISGVLVRSGDIGLQERNLPPPSLEEVQATAEGRVMRLRGYGNAIVPQVAAEFILASLDAIRDSH